eukprot:622649-Alexandrium_andersonii.AAC.1
MHFPRVLEALAEGVGGWSVAPSARETARDRPKVLAKDVNALLCSCRRGSSATRSLIEEAQLHR